LTHARDEQQDLAARAPYEAPRGLLCLDGVSGHVWWLCPELCQGQIWCHSINTSFGAYLASLLAYKRFRDSWKDLPLDLEYDVQAMQRTAFRPKRFTRIFSPNWKPLTRPASKMDFGSNMTDDGIDSRPSTQSVAPCGLAGGLAPSPPQALIVSQT
jgi:hypothetical protein